VKARRKEPGVDGARIPPNRGWHRPVPQQAHVIDAVRPTDHPTFRNPAAHAPRVAWATSRMDALDMLSLASMRHRRVDNATVRVAATPGLAMTASGGIWDLAHISGSGADSGLWRRFRDRVLPGVKDDSFAHSLN
jgi:hypothetical protein